jgi:hypothetical protein
MRLSALTMLAAAVGCGLFGVSFSSLASGRLAVGHRLAVEVPPGWRVSHKHFTPCSDPVERFSLIHGNQILMLQERLDPVAAELTRRPAHFSVRGDPSPIECCSISGHSGWVIQFSDHGRAFYAYLYPGDQPAQQLLDLLNTLQVG